MMVLPLKASNLGIAFSWAESGQSAQASSAGAPMYRGSFWHELVNIRQAQPMFPSGYILSVIIFVILTASREKNTPSGIP